MATTIARLQIEVGCAIVGYVREMNKAARHLEGFARRAESLGRNLTTGVTLPILGLGVAAVKMASDAVESEQRFAAVMGGMAGEARVFSEELKSALGTSSYEIRAMVATLQQMFSTMGLGQQAAYQMATGLTQLAQDLAASRRLAPAEVFADLQAAIVGGTKPLKLLGVAMDEGTVKAEALARGIIQPGQQLSAQQAVMVRYMALLRQTAADQGAAARNSGDLEAQFQRVKNALKDVARDLGVTLLPAYERLLTFGRALVVQIQAAVEWWKHLSTGQRATIITIAGVAAALGPLLLVMGKVARLIASIPKLLALVTSTAGATVAIVAILGFAAVTFIRNWDVVKIQFVALWAAIKNAVFESISFILGLMGKLPLVGGKFRDLQATLDAFAEESLAKSGRALVVLEQQLGASGTAAATATGATDDYAKALAGLASAAAGMGAGPALGAGTGVPTDLPARIAGVQAELRQALGEAGAGFQLFDASAIQTMTAQLDAYRAAAMALIAEGLSPQSAQVQVLLGQYNLLAAQIADANLQQERMNALQQAATQVIAETQTPLEAYVQRVRLLTTLLSGGLIVQQQFEAAVRQAMATYEEAVNPTFKLGEALQQGLTSALAGAAAALGTFLINLRGGFKSFLGGIMGLLGSIMKQLGQALIAFGVAGISIRKFIHNPLLAIVAGAALTALGSALGGAAQNIVERGGASMAVGAALGGGGSAAVGSGAGGSTGMATGPTIVELPPGRRIYDWSDPAQVAEFQAFWDNLVGRRVIFVNTA